MTHCPKCGTELTTETHAGRICEEADYCPVCKACYGYKQPATVKALQ